MSISTAHQQNTPTKHSNKTAAGTPHLPSPFTLTPHPHPHPHPARVWHVWQARPRRAAAGARGAAGGQG
eukprot:247035-Prymnesium_polylepis.1